MSFAGENLERLHGMKLEMPCLISMKEELSEEEMKNATMLTENIALVKMEFNQYVYV